MEKVNAGHRPACMKERSNSQRGFGSEPPQKVCSRDCMCCPAQYAHEAQKASCQLTRAHHTRRGPAHSKQGFPALTQVCRLGC
eukprot:1157686-Pelagomonas_calceolata.AAC.10